MKTNNIPEIRFSGFTGDWEQRELSDLATFIKGSGYSKQDLKESGSPIILYGRLYTNYKTLIEDVDTFVKEKENSVISLGGEVIVPSSGESAEDISRASVVGKPGIILGGDLNIIRPNKQIDPIFLALAISNGSPNRDMAKRAQGKSVVHLHNSDLKKINLIFPQIEEQRKLVGLNLEINDLITLHQQELTTLKQIKQGFLQKMFPGEGETTPEFRFAGFTGDWEQRKLGNTKTIFTDGNYGEAYPSDIDMSDSLHGVPFLRGSDLKNGYLDVSKSNYITKEKHKELTSGHLEIDDIVIAVRGSLGALGYTGADNIGWNINSQLAIIRTEKEELFGRFLIQYFLSNKGQKELLSRNTGTALKQLPIKQLKDVPVPITSMNEQIQIGNFFKQCDEIIALHERELDALNETKKAFLQKMFV
ncbi:restriction endonuclease subunit S [Paenibacillus xylanilyticus]|uniref:restriction endonuclease subunit S n=1 Tax=Paenibacillus xylanilyticus TaxID=248903 RepID=UPI0039A0EF1F